MCHSLQDSQDQAPLPIRQWGNTFTELFSPADLEKNAFLEGCPDKIEFDAVSKTPPRDGDQPYWLIWSVPGTGANCARDGILLPVAKWQQTILVLFHNP